MLLSSILGIACKSEVTNGLFCCSNGNAFKFNGTFLCKEVMSTWVPITIGELLDLNKLLNVGYLFHILEGWIIFVST